MMETKKRLFILLGIVAGLVIAGLLIFFFVVKPGEESELVELTEEEKLLQEIEQMEFEQAPGIVEGPTEAAEVVVSADAEELYVKQLARMFVERFGSYSNQNNNEHIETVLSLTTPSMANWIKTQGLEQSNEYSGKTTKVVVYRTESVGEGVAVVHVEVQEILETKDSEDREYRTGTVNLKKINETWKIDGLYWDN